MDPAQAEHRFAAMLAAAGLPCFTSAVHDPAAGELQLGWDTGFTLHIDLARKEWDPLDDWERQAILSGSIGGFCG